MAGNVQEWCADGYERDAYKRYAKGDLKPSASVAFMVLRGGSWKYGNPRNFRCATRYSTLLDIGYDDIGFRCARDASP
jgi:formylglycine-generating enzyme required for sulfatase activity